VDAFICYKQKCKVVSLNLAHPVVWILRNTLTLYAMWCSDYNQFCHHISVQINDTMFITGNMIHPTVTAVCPRHIDSVTDNRVGREPIDLLSCPHDPRDALGPVSHALVCLRLKSAARHDNACPRSHQSSYTNLRSLHHRQRRPPTVA